MKKIIMGEKCKCDYRKTCYGIVLKDDKLLLTHNKNTDEFSLIGGGVEAGESLEQGLKREFLEESGYKIKELSEFVNVDCFWTKRNGRKMETDANFMLVKVDENDVQKPIEDFHEPLWIDKENVIELIEYPYQRQALKIFLGNTSKFDFLDGE